MSPSATEASITATVTSSNSVAHRVDGLEELLAGRVVGVVAERLDDRGQARLGQHRGGVGEGRPVLGPVEHRQRVPVLAQCGQRVGDRLGDREPWVGHRLERLAQRAGRRPGTGPPAASPRVRCR